MADSKISTCRCLFDTAFGVSDGYKCLWQKGVMAQIFVFGRVTADLKLKESQKNTPYVCFDLAEHIGYGSSQRTLFYQVWAWGDDALRLIRIGVKQNSMLWLTGSQELVDNCGYIPRWQTKQNGADLPKKPETSPDMTAPPTMEVLDGEREALPE